MQGENLQIRFEKLKARPVLFSLFLALTLYIALVFATLIWLAIHTEDTIQRRIAQSPSVTVIIQKPATEENISDPAGEESTHSNDDAVIDTPPAEAPPASWNNKDTTAPDDANPTSDAQDQTSENKVPETTGTAEPVATTPLENKKLHWQSLARDFNHDDPRPRIGLIVVDLGVTQNISNQAITQLPADVALAFQTVSPDAAKWLEQSHKAGHENLISIPMEPNRYPQNDPGPHTLLTMLSAKDNAERLTQSLHYKTYALGVIPSQGEKFITDNKALTPVLNTLKDQELAFIDGTQNPKSVADSLARLACY
jgi:cytoskeletal protein RodZ